MTKQTQGGAKTKSFCPRSSALRAVHRAQHPPLAPLAGGGGVCCCCVARGCLRVRVSCTFACFARNNNNKLRDTGFLFFFLPQMRSAQHAHNNKQTNNATRGQRVGLRGVRCTTPLSIPPLTLPPSSLLLPFRATPAGRHHSLSLLLSHNSHTTGTLTLAAPPPHTHRRLTNPSHLHNTPQKHSPNPLPFPLSPLSTQHTTGARRRRPRSAPRASRSASCASSSAPRAPSSCTT